MDVIDGNSLHTTYIYATSAGGMKWSLHSTLHADNDYYTPHTRGLKSVQGKLHLSNYVLYQQRY
jgi:hypothetical protein